MPKDKSSRSSAPRDTRNNPYNHHIRSSNVDACAQKKEWEDVVCPICLECPHNAVLLMCTSHEKGCRPYMCDTSYRHSNCLDQYQKAQVNLKKAEPASGSEPLNSGIMDAESPAVSHTVARRPSINDFHPPDTNAPENILSLRLTSVDYVVGTRRSRRNATISASRTTNAIGARQVGSEDFEDQEESVRGNHVERSSASEKGDAKELLCPLCRGKVTGWQVVGAARKHLNGKLRSCSQESCLFVGTYEELRAHARSEHPSARPSEVDPARQRDWRRLEHQRDMGDVLSSIRSAMPGAAVFEDYVIEDDREIESEDIDILGDEGQWLRVFFLFQIFGPAASVAREGSISSRVRGHQLRQQQRRAGAARIRQWVENLHRVNNEANNPAGSNGNGTEETTETPHGRRRNRHRYWGDAS